MIRASTAVVLASLALVLVLPAGSQATLTEVGVIPPTTNPETVPSCPGSPCLAVSRTTGFQVKVGTAHNPLAAPRAGTVVAWSIDLGKPNATQIKFFNANEGGPSTAGIAVLRPQKKPNLTYTLTVPSWAPALALGFNNETSWRASRPKSQCTSTSAQTTHTQVGTAVQYYCLYLTARLTYSATLISTP